MVYVHQGGVTSMSPYCLFFNGLLKEFRGLKVGYTVNGLFAGGVCQIIIICLNVSIQWLQTPTL